MNKIDAAYYLHLIKQFTDRGDVFTLDFKETPELKDPILLYLHHIMSDPLIQSKVLSSRLAGKIFYETIGKFVLDCLHREQFASQRAISEKKQIEKTKEWTEAKKEDHWQTLLDTTGEKHKEDGFDLDFLKKRFQASGWDNPENWEMLRHEWSAAIDKRIQQQKADAVNQNKAFINRHLNRQFALMEKLKTEGMQEEQAMQAWEMMEGQWTETEFEKKLNIVNIQNKYPEIGDVAKRMGRLPDEDGKERLFIQSGNSHKLTHATGSDIEGITIGNDLHAMMPQELAQYADAETEKLFLKKYMTRKLQIFRYKSEITKPSRRLHPERASLRGPMIVCIDSSDSMNGIPKKIEASLLSKLEQTAESLNRDCFLIDFSVGIRPIELRSRRKQRAMERIGMRAEDNENFAKGLFPFIGGGTDAQKMLNLTFSLLDNQGDRYMNADVLWITDFLIPRTTENLMRKFKEYQKRGTRFYGFKIGNGKSDWEQYFDKVYEIHYTQPRRY